MRSPGSGAESGEIVVPDGRSDDPPAVTSSKGRLEEDRDDRPSRRERRSGADGSEELGRRPDDRDREVAQERVEEGSRRSQRDDHRRETRHASRDDSGRHGRSDSRGGRPRTDEGREVSGREGSGRDREGREGRAREERDEWREGPSRGRDRDGDVQAGGGGSRRGGDLGKAGPSGVREGERDRKDDRDRDRERDNDRSTKKLSERSRHEDGDRGHKRRRKRSRSRSKTRDASRSRSRSLLRRASKSPSRNQRRPSRSPGRAATAPRRPSRSPGRGHRRAGSRSPGRGAQARRSASPSRGGYGQRRDRSRSRSPRRNGRDDDRKRGGARGEDSPQELPDEVEEKLLKFVGGQEDEEDEEQRRIEERRRRLQEIKLKHAQLAASQAGAPSAPAAAGAAPGFLRNASFVRDGSEPASDMPAGSGAARAAAAAAGASDADDRDDGATPAAGGGDGERTPEGDRESDSDSEGGGVDGPVMDIFADVAAADDPTAPSVPVSVVPTGSATGAAKVTHETKGGGAIARQGTVDADEEDDMFAEHAPEDKFGAAPGAGAAAGATAGAPAPVAALADAYDDHEGYYNFVVGEMMDGRYEVFASNGKGVFSSVVRARDTSVRDEAGRHPEVAIKLIRSNETMFKAAQTEVQVLKLLGAADPDNHKHCIRLIRHFEYRHHMCLVFEPMAMNLRDLTRKFGRNKGLDVKAVQLFTCQLLIALRHLRKNNVLHADIKPDNILINHRHNKVKLCDFGSAMFLGDNEVTPYLVSRFYRAPEVIMGLKYDFGMDMWSIGCVIYELFTGRILFPGHSNNEMLKLMMEVKGPFTKKMLRKGMFVDKHFENDQNMSFASMEDDPITKTKVRRLITNPSVKHNFTQLLQRSGNDKADKALVAQLADLLEKMMNLEPEKRIDVDSALKHPFVRDVLPKRKEKEAAKRKALT